MCFLYFWGFTGIDSAYKNRFRNNATQGAYTMQTFTIRENPGKVIKVFEAETFDEFKAAIASERDCGSEQGLESFFFDRFQVKTLIGGNRLVCR